MKPQVAHGLERALARIGWPAPTGLERLSGGASMESWRFVSGNEAGVLRRASSPDVMAGRLLDHPGEAALIRAAHSAGVLAPEVLAVLEPDDAIGTGFVMRALPGTPDPAQILAMPSPGVLLADLAGALAAIHRVPVAGLPVPVMDTAAALAELRARLASHGGDRPILALALRWLEGHLPAPVAPRLIHGDFRLGNLLAVDGRLSGVLDWELAHLGDPHEDLAYGCMTVWRFARADRAAFGLGTIDELITLYEAAGGAPVDRARLRFWLVYRTFWWALGCLQMGAMWRSHADRSLERVVVARRTCEQELDLLMLLEQEAPAAERARAVPPAPAAPPAPVGEPGAAEVLTAVSEWLARDIKPLVSGRGKFDLAVARNALGIAVRELEQRPAGTDAALAAELLDGHADLTTPHVLAQLRRMALDKLAADMPKYPALALARAHWEGPA